jgi:SAM-dependent methyltransferase
MEELKKQIRDYWTKNVPGLDVGLSKRSIDDPEFYRVIDKHRFENEPYLTNLIRPVVKPGGKLLEIGCGLGRDLREFAKNDMSVCGMDLAYRNSFLTKKVLSQLASEAMSLMLMRKIYPLEKKCLT